MIERNDPCFCGSSKKWKKCHYPHLPPRDFASSAREYKKRYGIILKTPEEVQGIRRSCHLAADVLKKTCAMAKVGVTTDEVNAFAEDLMRKAGAVGASLGYGSPPFPKSICISLNDVICHGIPGSRELKPGDIFNIDVTSILDGYYGDCSAMVALHPIDPEKQRVVDVSKECLHRAIKILKPGVLVSEIGNTIEAYATANGCSVVHQFVAHGVGCAFHELPQIPHYANDLAIPLVEGMTFTIEPMINAGVPDAVIDEIDHWTARTADGKPSAQWEHTVLITADGHEILTLI